MNWKNTFEIDKMEFDILPPRVYPCLGKFVKPTKEQIRCHSTKLFKMFTPLDGSYLVTFYNEREIINAIKKELTNIK